ncbi:hypothetical protein D3C75_590380 [compost metagenome]
MAGTHKAQRRKITGTIVVIFKEERINVHGAKQHFSHRLVTAFRNPRRAEITATNMQTNNQIIRLACQGFIQHFGINLRQLVRVITTLANVLTLRVRTQICPNGVVKLQITAACCVKCLNRIAPRSRQIVEIFFQIRVYGAVDCITSTAEMQHARAWDRHFWHGIATDALQIAEIFQHRVFTEAQFADHSHAVRFGLHAVKLNALLGLITLNTLQAIEKVKMPPRTTKLAVSHHMQAAGTLLFNRGTNGVIFHFSQLRSVDISRCKSKTCVFNGGRA